MSENEKGRVQQTPEERTTDRDLGAPSPATVPTIPYRSGDTGGEILGKDHKEKADEQRSPQRGTRCGELSSPPGSEVLFGRLTCVLSALPTSPDLTVRGTGYTYPSLHSLGDCIVVGVFCVFCLWLMLLLSRNRFPLNLRLSLSFR